jgi:hypothetical protein
LRLLAELHDCKMIPGPMAWAIHLPNILLELWSDRRRSAGLRLRGPKPRRQMHAALRQTEND